MVAETSRPNQTKHVFLGGYRGQRVGEASNPGPSGPTVYPTLLQLNVGGAPGAWRLYHHNFCDADILALQDLSMSPDEWSNFSRKAASKGFKCYYQIGSRGQGTINRNRYYGGVAFLMHKTVSHRFGGSTSSFGVQILSVWINGVQLVNMYVPPGQHEVGLSTLGEFWETQELDKHPWITLGDFNEEPSEGTVPGFLRIKNGTLIGDSKEPTRWEGHRCIDLAYTKPDTLATFHSFLETKISDHKGNFLELEIVGAVGKTKGRIAPSPLWIKPENIPTDTWQDALEKAWEKMTQDDSTYVILSKTLDKPSTQDTPKNVQRNWDFYMTKLQQTFRFALLHLKDHSDNTEVQKEVTDLLKRPGWKNKGFPARFQWVNEGGKWHDENHKGEKLRRIRRRLARHYEARRWCHKGTLPPRCLSDKLGLTPSDDLDVSWCLDRINNQLTSLNKLQTEAEEEEKIQRLKRWKTQVTDPSLKGLGRWLRKKSASHDAVNIVYKENIATNRIEAANMIFNYWGNLWTERNLDWEQLTGKLVCDFGPVQNNQNWEDLPVGEL